MRRTVCLCICITICFAVCSQNKLGIFAGVQTTTAKYNLNDVRQPRDYKYGFNAGIGWKIPFENHLYFSPCAFYSLKGYKVRFTEFHYPPDSLATNNNTTVHTFNLAFLLQFDFGDKPTHLFLKLGPSLDFQIAGKEKFYLKNGTRVSRSMPYGFADYGRYSASVITQFGVETQRGLLFYGHCDMGLGNLSNSDGGPIVKHRALGLSFGTYINKKRM